MSVIDSRKKNHIKTGSNIDRDFTPDLFSTFPGSFQDSVNAILEDMGLLLETPVRIPAKGGIEIDSIQEPLAPVSGDEDFYDTERIADVVAAARVSESPEEAQQIVIISDEPLDKGYVEALGHVQVPEELQELISPSRKSEDEHWTTVDSFDFDNATEKDLPQERNRGRVKKKVTTKPLEDILASVSPRPKKTIVAKEAIEANAPITLPKAVHVESAEKDDAIVPAKKHKTVPFVIGLVIFYIFVMLAVGYFTTQGVFD